MIAREAILVLNNTEDVVRRTISSLKDQMLCNYKNHGANIVVLDDAIAYLKVKKGSVWLRVEAKEMMICHGARMLITKGLSEHARDMPTDILWIDASDAPFAALVRLEELI